MKNKELKTLWKVARGVWIAGTLIWFVETLVFLLIEGWHIKPTNSIEIYFDRLVGEMWHFALWLTIYIGVQYLYNLNKK